MATAPDTHAYLIIQVQQREHNNDDVTPFLHIAGPASPEELKRLAGLVKDGAWGDSKNHDFIRSDQGFWSLHLSPESESVRFRAWLMNTFASMGFRLVGVRSVSSDCTEFYLERPRR